MCMKLSIILLSSILWSGLFWSINYFPNICKNLHLFVVVTPAIVNIQYIHVYVSTQKEQKLEQLSIYCRISLFALKCQATQGVASPRGASNAA